MDDQKFTTSQGKSMMILYILGVTLILLGYSGANADTWLACVISIPMALVLVVIYDRILKLYPNKDIHQILKTIYGKYLGSITSFIFIVFFIILGAFVLRNMSEYIQVVSMENTPQYVTVIFISLVSLYAVNSGMEVLFRWAKFILPIIIIVTLITVLLSIPRFNYSYIKPVLYNGWKPVLISSFNILMFPFGEVIIFLPLLSGLENKTDTKKVFIHSIILSGTLILILSIRNILLLGVPNLSLTYFPSFYASSIIKIGNFIQRSEVIVSINLLLAGLSKFCVILLAVSISLNNLFKTKDYRKYSTIVCILMGVMSLFVYKNTMNMFLFLKIYPYFAAPFFIIIPLITLVVGGIRKKVKKR